MIHNLQIAIEEAMASTASTVHIEDGRVLNKEMQIEIAMRGLYTGSSDLYKQCGHLYEVYTYTVVQCWILHAHCLCYMCLLFELMLERNHL